MAEIEYRFFVTRDEITPRAEELSVAQVSDSVATDGTVLEIDNRVTAIEQVVIVPPSSAPQIINFSVSVIEDDLTVDLTWQTFDDVGVTQWIVKEDSTTTPLLTDSDWSLTEPSTFEMSNYNQHTLTAWVRDADDNLSVPVTVSVQVPVTTLPLINIFSVSNPLPDSSTYTFNLSISSGTPTHYIIIDNSNTPPLTSDPGWTSATFPLTSTSATLDSFIDSTVYAYVKDASNNISPAKIAFVDVSEDVGDTDPTTGDYLWQNNPTLTAYTGSRTITVSENDTITVDGKVSGGLLNGSASFADGIRFNGDASLDTDTTNGATIIVKNMNLTQIRKVGLYFNDCKNCTVTIYNCKIEETNYQNEINNTTFKSAIVGDDCDGWTINIYGNWFNGSDGGFVSDGCRVTVAKGYPYLNFKYNWAAGMTMRSTAATAGFVRGIGYVQLNFSNYRGEISNNILYAPNSDHEGEDLFSCRGMEGGIASDHMTITRNRIWGDDPTKTTAACFQIGDGVQGSSYIDCHENTIIDWSTPGQISAGNNNKFRNNKAYTSEIRPARGAGYPFQMFRCCTATDSPPGSMFDCTVENNTMLHFLEDGTNRAPYFPSSGHDQLGPNHGECVGTCGTEDNVAPTGWNTNNWQEASFSGGAGKSLLWRSSWNSFRYAGANGTNPSIDYSSPWIGDGGGQAFSVSSVSGNVAYGDQAEIDSSQTHNVIILASGGITPYSLDSVSGSINCSVGVSGSNVVFTAGATAGAFSYNFTISDANLSSVQGTVSGTIVNSGATSVPHFDQNGNNYIAIEPHDYHEYYARDGKTYDPRSGSGSPDGTYQQQLPYSANIASGDVETLASELVYRVHFDGTYNGTYKIYINGMALFSSSYNQIWIGVDDTVSNYAQVTTATDPLSSADWYWDDGTGGGGAVTITTTGTENHTIHVWTKRGGFALGKIQLVRSIDSAPTGSGSTISPENNYVP